MSFTNTAITQPLLMDAGGLCVVVLGAGAGAGDGGGAPLCVLARGSVIPALNHLKHRRILNGSLVT